MGGRAQLGQPARLARLAAQNGGAGRQGRGDVPPDAQRHEGRKRYGDQAAQRQNHGRYGPPGHGGAIMPVQRWFGHVAVAAIVVFGAASSVPGAPAAWRDLSGIYWTNSYSPKIVPVGGGDLPYKPAAMAEYRK